LATKKPPRIKALAVRKIDVPLRTRRKLLPVKREREREREKRSSNFIFVIHSIFLIFFY